MNLDQLKYPIGKFEWVVGLSQEALKKQIQTLRSFPKELTEMVTPISDDMLQKRYRPDGWTIAQVVHHIADSHSHSYLRCKHAILEDTPDIKDYNEDDWANLTDGSSIDIQPSLLMIQGIHLRWVLFLELLKEADFKKTYFHPQRGKHYPLDTTTALYAWHCKHHLAHIKNTLLQPYE